MLKKRQKHNTNAMALPALIIATMILGACSSNDDSEPMVTDTASTTTGMGGGAGTGGDTTAGTQGQTLAFAATASYPTGQIERISLADGFTVNGTYPATKSDIRAETDGKALYELGRYQLDSVTKFSPSDTSMVEYQYSVNGDEIATNPHDIVFVNETKAYVLRYGSPTVWIINPSATNESEFKIGELDLSAYDPDSSDEDLSPKATSGVIVDGKLFVLMQRLTGFNPIESGYVAVFDINTDTEIDTGTGSTADALKGIALPTLNPTNIRYNEATEEIYITGRGNIYVELNSLPGDPYSGGLFAINPANYNVSQLLDDGDANSNTLGFIESTLVVSDTKGYATLYASTAPADATISRSTLYTFNPSTGELGSPVAGIDGTVSFLAHGADKHTWVGVRSETAPGIARLNTADDSLVEPFIVTSFSPLNVVFIDAPTP